MYLAEKNTHVQRLRAINICNIYSNIYMTKVLHTRRSRLLRGLYAESRQL